MQDVRSCILLPRRLRLAGCRAHLQSLEGSCKQHQIALAATASEAGGTTITGETSLKGKSYKQYPLQPSFASRAWYDEAMNIITLASLYKDEMQYMKIICVAASSCQIDGLQPGVPQSGRGPP